MAQGEVQGVEVSSVTHVFLKFALFVYFCMSLCGALGEAGGSRLQGSQTVWRADGMLNRVNGVENHRV